MTTPGALFEAPAAHEAHSGNPYSNPEDYSNPYSNPEGYSSPEFEWETHEAHEAHYSNPYSSPEAYSSPESEWETHEAHYSNPYSNPEGYSNPESEWEADEAHEAHEAHYSNPYSNPEEYSNPYSNPEDYSNPYSNPEFEWEDEGEYFFKKAFKFIKRAAQVVAPIAKRLAPFAAKALVSMIPGVGALAAPLVGQLTSQLLKEGAMEAAEMEAEFFGTNEAEAEIANTELAHEAALTELLAAEAASAESEAEAEATLAAALPITITIMGGRRPLRPVMPTLAQANGRLVAILRRQGPEGRQLLRLVPTIQRRAVATMRAAARSGQPVTGPLAVRAMAAATHSVLNNPRLVQQALVRNALVRQRVAPPTPRRAAVFMPQRTLPSNPRRAAAMRTARPRSA